MSLENSVLKAEAAVAPAGQNTCSETANTDLLILSTKPTAKEKVTRGKSRVSHKPRAKKPQKITLTLVEYQSPQEESQCAKSHLENVPETAVKKTPETHHPDDIRCPESKSGMSHYETVSQPTSKRADSDPREQGKVENVSTSLPCNSSTDRRTVQTAKDNQTIVRIVEDREIEEEGVRKSEIINKYGTYKSLINVQQGERRSMRKCNAKCIERLSDKNIIQLQNNNKTQHEGGLKMPYEILEKSIASKSERDRYSCLSNDATVCPLRSDGRKELSQQNAPADTKSDSAPDGMQKILFDRWRFQTIPDHPAFSGYEDNTRHGAGLTSGHTEWQAQEQTELSSKPSRFISTELSPAQAATQGAPL